MTKRLGCICTLLTCLIMALMVSGCVHSSVSNHTGIGFDNASYMIEIWASTYCAMQGDTLHVRGTLTSNSSETRVFQVKSKPIFDIGVAFGDLRVNWSDGRVLTPDLTRLELKPAESKTLEMDWVVTGTVLTGGAGAGFTFGLQPDDHVGVSVPIYIEPACPSPWP